MTHDNDGKDSSGLGGSLLGLGAVGAAVLCCAGPALISAGLPGEAAVMEVLAASRLWTAATSFGGVHSTIDRRAQWGADAVEPGFLRLSCGIEDTRDLVEDLSAALDSLR